MTHHIINTVTIYFSKLSQAYSTHWGIYKEWIFYNMKTSEFVKIDTLGRIGGA